MIFDNVFFFQYRLAFCKHDEYLNVSFSNLRQWSESVNLIGSAMIGNSFFSYNAVFQSGINALSKRFKQETVFYFVLFCFVLFCCQNVHNFVLFGPYNFVQISPACGTNILKECMERLLIPMSAKVTVN